MFYKYPGIRSLSAVWWLEKKKKNENLSSNAHVVHATAKQVISRRRLDESRCDMYKKQKNKKKKKNEIARAKRVKHLFYLFYYQGGRKEWFHLVNFPMNF